jgi:hypothetical protein
VGGGRASRARARRCRVTRGCRGQRGDNVRAINKFDACLGICNTVFVARRNTRKSALFALFARVLSLRRRRRRATTTRDGDARRRERNRALVMR